MDEEPVLSVRQRRQLFESASAPVVPTKAFLRDRSGSVVPQITISEEPPLTILEPRPEPDDSPVQNSTPPPKPPRPQSFAGIARNGTTHDRLNRVVLYDGNQTTNDIPGQGSDALTTADSDSRASSPSKSPRRRFTELARGAQSRATLLVDSALNETQKTAAVVRRKSDEIGQNARPIISLVGQNLDQFGNTTSKVVRSTGVPDVVEVVARGVKGGAVKVKIGAEGFAEKLGIPRTFAGTKQDIVDIKAKFGSKNGLCSHCRSLPVQLCFPTATDCSAPEIVWATPLARIIYHASWCRLCSLFQQMLSREKNDPLRHPLVGPHLPENLKGMSFEQWVAKGWYWTDQNWPFGQGDQRNEYATQYLGMMGSVVAEGSKQALKWGVATANVVLLAANLANLGNRNYQYRRPTRWTSSRDVFNGRDMKSKSQFPLSCVLQIRMRTHVDFESPGLMLVELVGFGRDSQAQPAALSTFMLRAAKPDAPGRPLSSGPLSYGRLMDRSWIDLGFVRACLEACEQHHGQSCSEHGWAIAMKRPDFIRVIDVQDLCIVAPSRPQDCRYVALSYVWGNAQSQMPALTDVDALPKPGSLRQYLNNMPRTITDAIEAVRAVGERYLWVDALCIHQHNAEDKTRQINNMDRIYGSALMTLVAADGTDANSGLHGVKRKHLLGYGEGVERMSEQVSAPLDRNCHIIAPFKNDQNVERTAWNSRAWTFQERVLSKRFLIFGSNEVTWHCSAMSAREDMLVKDSGYGQPLPGRLSLTPQHLGVDLVHEHWEDGSFEITRHGETKLVRCARFHEYSKMVGQYTHRRMTKDSDIINALAGLLRIFDLAFKSRMMYGLPEVLFDVALLWSPAERLIHRAGEFPTWSWAGWKGHVTYEVPFVLERKGARSPSRLMHDNYGEEGVRPFVRWYIWSRSARSLTAINGNGIGFPLEGDKFPREWEKAPHGFSPDGVITKRPDPSLMPLPADLLQNHHLIFWTSASKAFNFGDETTQSSDRLATTKSPPLRRSIADADFEWAGTVLLDGSKPDWLEPTKHEFILIGEAQYFRLDDEPRKIEGYPLYLVMLIEWNLQTNVAQRLGLGRIKKQAWRQSQFEKKLVVLG